MPLATKSNHRTTAVANRRLTLRLLSRHQSLSRRQLAALTGLQHSTLTYIVRELLDKRIVRTGGRRESETVGPKQVLLEFNPDLGWTAGVNLTPRGPHVMLMDAAGEMIDHRSWAMQTALEHMAPHLRALLEAWLKERGTPPGEFLGVAVGMPGVVDSELGIVRRSTAFKASELPLRALLAESFGVPVIIDHNANFAAGAEAQYGAARNINDFIQFLMNHDTTGEQVTFKSYGAALFLRGELYRGVHFAAGELDLDMAPRGIFSGESHHVALLAEPEAPLTPLLEDLAASVGRSIAHAVNFLDPHAVILGGDQVFRNQAFLQAVQRAMQSSLIPIAGRDVRVLASTLGDRAVAKGAALAAINAARIELAAQPD